MESGFGGASSYAASTAIGGQPFSSALTDGPKEDALATGVGEGEDGKVRLRGGESPEPLGAGSAGREWVETDVGAEDAAAEALLVCLCRRDDGERRRPDGWHGAQEE